jgi:hypothetical protein
MDADAHLSGLGRAGAVGIVVVERLRLRDILVEVHVRVGLVGDPGTVRRLMMHQKAEGFITVPLFKPIEAHVGDQVSDVSLNRPSRAAVGPLENELGIMIDTLAGALT